jgi:hypothetical protein
MADDVERVNRLFEDAPRAGIRIQVSLSKTLKIGHFMIQFPLEAHSLDVHFVKGAGQVGPESIPRGPIYARYS